MLRRRGSGILLHITSLPSEYGIGDLGPGAYDFADFLRDADQSYWQVLPLNPTDPVSGCNSPYSSFSAFAGSNLMISPDLLLRAGLISEDECKNATLPNTGKANYPEVIKVKNRLFDAAFTRFKKLGEHYEFDLFCKENESWLDDFALFIALKNHFNDRQWCDWPKALRDRDASALKQIAGTLEDPILREKFLQFQFFKQWRDLKRYCNRNGIQVIGDVPYYTSYDSADVWTHPELFKLDREKKPTHGAGVPPDYFSSTGQLWGNPVFRWDVMQKNGFKWWLSRIEHNLSLFDMIRVDHFRGFVAYWEVPSSEKTAIKGNWIESPGLDFFNTLLRRFPNLPIIAEDLGVITPDVRELIQRFDFPGMRLLLFAFDDSLSQNPYAPHNHVENCIVYTGTHDNNTVRGWFDKDATPEEKERLSQYLGKNAQAGDIHFDFIRMAMMSVANTAIIPMQDFLGCGNETRMNRPSTTDGNWEWRVRAEDIRPDISKVIADLTRLYGRS